MAALADAETLENTLLSVWQQTMVDDATVVKLGEGVYKVRRTSRRRLREVDFPYKDQMIRGLEQNPDTGSRFAKLARDGKKVMQFLIERRYIANVIDGKVLLYAPGRELDKN